MELTRRMANTSIFNFIINKFCFKKKLYLIILLKIDKNLKIGFHYAILSLVVAVCL